MDAADKTSSESQADSGSPTRVDHLWFYDHGLVIQAGNRLFRVSSATLAARSSVFRDMLSIPQPAYQPLIDGCPVVLLHDSPVDAEYFLTAIFDSGFFERPPVPTTCPIMSGILKLSTKYDVEYLRRRALLHLSTALPQSLEEFDSCDTFNPFGFSSSSFSLLVLVHELDITWALPMAFYLAACSPVQDIVDGTTFNGTRVHLPQTIQKVVLMAKCILVATRVRETFRFLRYLPCEDCLSPTLCRDRGRRRLDNLGEPERLNPLMSLVDWWPYFSPSVCAPCLLAAKKEHSASRRKIWDALPAMLGLDTWEVLHKARSADLGLS
ncbi:hypothetical protein DFH06DRAFT_1079440 [Mycena polygramma]|nr:hypothetical protein DFH06DRAFT_1079440 [Mycena polygramma]